MSFLKKLTSAFGQGSNDAETPAALVTLSKDSRLHARYLVHGEGVALINIGGATGVVKDISYGGIAVRFDEGDAAVRAIQNMPADGPMSGSLAMLDMQVTCKFQPVRTVQSGAAVFVGFAMRHETPDTLIFLRNFIEPMRCGESLALLRADVRQERYRSPEWQCWRGDGPTDLIMRTDSAGRWVEEALLTFRSGDTYREVSFKGGHLRTGRSTNDGSLQPGAGMSSTSDIDKTVLRQAIYILLGAPASVRACVEPLMQAAMTSLKTKSKAA